MGIRKKHMKNNANVLGFFPKNRKSHTFTNKVTCLKIANFNSLLQNVEKRVFLNKTTVKISFIVFNEQRALLFPDHIPRNGKFFCLKQ